MLFNIQTYLEDYFNRLNIKDPDGYAVKVANLYFNQRYSISRDDFLRKLTKVKTVLYIVNTNIDSRIEFEQELIDRLDRKFKKKSQSNNAFFPSGLSKEKVRFQSKSRKTIDFIVSEFKHAVESRAIDAFWESRKQCKLKSKPEKIAQTLFAIFSFGVIGQQGIVLREIFSGIGFVDIGIIFTKVMHLLEIKVLLKSRFDGPNQLEEYMKTERRDKGNLLIIDSLPYDKKIIIPSKIPLSHGIIKVQSININPVPPSRLN